MMQPSQHPVLSSQPSSFVKRSPHPLRVLVVEDDPVVQEACLEMAAVMGFATGSASSLDSAHRALTEPVDIVLLDLKLPDGDGLSLLDEIRSLHPSAIVVIMTAFASVDSAVEALRVGAGDYLAKPFTLEDLSTTLERAAERRTFDVEAHELREQLREGRGHGRLVGRSPGMEKLYRILSKVAFTTHPLLVLGEAGTGKGVVAQAVHLNGPRAADPFYSLHCSNASAEALESQLFGSARLPDSALLAQPGTLYLEEIADLPLALQARLLRALETRQLSTNGAPLPLAARLIASSSRDLAPLVENGRFRKDLFYRLNVVNLRIPPLRERKEDIPQLAASVLEKIGAERNQTYTIARDAARLLLDYDWPGNVRELHHALERALALSSGPVLHLGDFPTQLQNARAERDHRRAATSKTPSLAVNRSGQVIPIAELEKQAILNTLRHLEGDKLLAARLLGIGKTTLYRKLKEYGVADQHP